MQITRRAIPIDGAEIHVEERGSGEPLLLLHGLMGTGRDWQHAFDLDALAARHRVIVPDARGHGRSTNPAGAFTFGRCASDVLALLDALGVGKARAVGLSLGAETLLHVATREPARLIAMVVVSATPCLPEATRALFRSVAAAEHTADDWTAMRAMHERGDEAIRALWALPRRFADDPADMTFTAERLAAVRAETLIVSGDRDPFYPVELAVELYRGIPGASLWVVPGGGHGPIFLAQREAFVRAAEPFMSAEATAFGKGGRA